MTSFNRPKEMMSEEDHDLNIKVRFPLAEEKGTWKYMGCEWQIQLNTDKP